MIAFSRCARAALAAAAFLAATAAAQADFPADRNSPDAERVIRNLQGIAEKSPALSDQVRACLYPLVRDLPRGDDGGEQAPEPQPRRLLLTRTPGGGASAVRAESVRPQGTALIITTNTGGKAVILASNVEGEVPWYSEQDMNGGRVDLVSLAAKYEAASAAAPLLKAFLQSEADRFRSLAKMREAERARAEKEVRKKVEAAIAEKFDPARPPSAEEITALLEDAERVVADCPDAAGEIDAWAAPYRDHLARLLAGDEWTGGKWVTAEERRQAEQARLAAEARKNLAFTIDAAVAGDAAVRKVLMTPVWVAVAAMILAAACLIFFRGSGARFVAMGVLAGAPLALALVFFFASSDPPGLPATPPGAREDSVVDLLLAAKKNAPTKEGKTLKQDDVNVFLAKRLRLRSAQETDASLRAVSIRLSPGVFAVYELVRALGFEWIVRADYAVVMDQSGMQLEVTGVSIGRLPCPAVLAHEILDSIESNFEDVLSESGLLAAYDPLSPVEGGIDLLPKDSHEPPVQPPVGEAEAL